MKISLQTFLLGLLLFTASTQFGIHFWPQWSFVYGIRVDYLSPTVYFFDLVLLCGVLTNLSLTFTWIQRNVNSVLLFVICLLISMLYSFDWHVSLYKGLRLSELLLLYILVSQIKIKKEVLRIVFGSIIFLIALTSFLQIYSGKSIEGIFYFLGERHLTLSMPGIAKTYFKGHEILRPYSFFSHPNSMAGFLGVSLFIYLWSLPDRKLFTDWIIGIGGFLTLLLSFSFNAISATFLSFIFLIISRRRKKLLSVAFTILVIASIISLALPSSFNISKRQDVFERIQLLHSAAEIFTKKPVVGVGVGNFIPYMSFNAKPNQTIWKLQPVHNIYVLLLVEIGLPLFVVWYCITFAFIRNTMIYKRERFLYAAFFFILTTGFLDHYHLSLQQNSSILAILLGLIKKSHDQIS